MALMITGENSLPEKNSANLIEGSRIKQKKQTPKGELLPKGPLGTLLLLNL